MPTPEFEAAVRRATRRRHATLAEDLARFREDAGESRTRLAAEAGVDRRYLDRIEDGRARPSIETYQRLALALGTDLATRLYPTTGPVIRDRHQARLLELLLAHLHPRWHAFTEVAVRRPGRGWIDAALHDPRENVLIATELQSELRRLEQIVRWSAEKAASLSSWEGWQHLGEEPRTSQLLIVRHTRATQAVGTEFERQLRVAFPAHPDDALAALTGTAPWPGAALVWARLDGGGPRFVAHRR
jgi:transcriptional regulator with XRE-family HTH domain